MNRIRLLAIGTVLVFALSTVAQQTTTSPDAHAAAAAPVEQHLKALSQKLDLTADQQDRVRPILQEMHDGAQKLDDDQTLTPDQHQEGIRPLITKADREIREVLNDDQKKKLDELEAQMHPVPHANPDGAASAPHPQM